MTETDHDAMVRWQGYAREHRSTVNSLFMTYAAALFGLQCSILLSKDVTQVYWSKCFVATAILALISLLSGGVVVVVRLHDARITARIARYRSEQKTQDEIKPLREQVDDLGWWTNNLIPIQFTSFALAALSFLIWVILSFHTKLG